MCIITDRERFASIISERISTYIKAIHTAIIFIVIFYIMILHEFILTIIINITLRSMGTVHRLLASRIIMYIITIYAVNNKNL